MRKNRIVALPFWLVLGIFGCPDNPSDHDRTEEIKRDFVWTVDTLNFDLPGILPPEQVLIQSVWGSSPRDVWAVGHSDIVQGRLWRYDGERWRTAKGWQTNGNDGKPYIVQPFAVTGFDSQNVFVACDRSYEDDDSAMVLHWNGNSWSDVPWNGGTRAAGGLGWIVNQPSHGRIWAVSAAGMVVRLENEELTTEPRFTDYRLGSFQIASLDNGFVYVNAYKDSLDGGIFLGTLSNLFVRNDGGEWERVEQKYIPGSYYDGQGLGRSIFSVGHRLFTSNAGIHEMSEGGWTVFSTFSDFGGVCAISVRNIWVYYRQALQHYNGNDFISTTIDVTHPFSGAYFYGQGWSDGTEIFLAMHHEGKTYVVHGR